MTEAGNSSPSSVHFSKQQDIKIENTLSINLSGRKNLDELTYKRQAQENRFAS